MKTIIKNEHAQAGVGTLIIFIAMVLVAAVAAAVLIQTSGVMQSKSTTTTKEAAEAITENLVIESVTGNAKTTAAELSSVNITIKLGPGSGDINLSKVVLIIKAQQVTPTITVLRDVDSSLANSQILKAGALARIDAGVSSITGLTSKQPITISLTPEKGTTTNMPITLPTISTNATGIALYP